MQSSQPAGHPSWVLQEVGPPFCSLRERACDGSFGVTCESGSLVYCTTYGEERRIDCSALGFRGCGSTGFGEPSCLPTDGVVPLFF